MLLKNAGRPFSPERLCRRRACTNRDSAAGEESKAALTSTNGRFFGYRVSMHCNTFSKGEDASKTEAHCPQPRLLPAPSAINAKT